MKSIGVIDIKIRVRLNSDISPDLARKFVNELDYEIKDTTSQVSIEGTEIIEDNIEEQVEFHNHVMKTF